MWTDVPSLGRELVLQKSDNEWSSDLHSQQPRNWTQPDRHWTEPAVPQPPRRISVNIDHVPYNNWRLSYNWVPLSHALQASGRVLGGRLNPSPANGEAPGSVHNEVTRRPDITGCAVAQHCYNGDVSFLWKKMETLTSCKIETLEQIDTQFVRID